MNILFISSNLIGDSILSTGILAHIVESNKNAKITIVTGPTAKQLFEDFPQISNIITIEKKKFSFHWVTLWMKLINSKWDLVIDLRSSLLSYLLRGNRRMIFRKNMDPVHQVEKLSNFMNLGKILLPKIFINNNKNEAAKQIIGIKNVIAIAPGGNWLPKIWDIENFCKLLIELEKIYKDKDLHYLIIGSKDESKYFYHLEKNIPNNKLVNFLDKSLTLTHACISLCKFFVGNDSGLMHLSAASNTPTIGLFGPTRDDWYAPYGKKCYVIRTKESYQELRDQSEFFSATSLMSSIQVKDLINLINEKELI